MPAQKGIGRLIQFGVAKETTRGTSEATAQYYIPVNELNTDEKDEKVVENQSLGVIEDSNNQLIVKQWAEHTVKAPLTDKTFGLFLLNLLGTETKTLKAGETVVYDHAFSVAQSAQHQALSLFVDDPLANQDYKYALGMCESLEIAYERGKIVEYTAKLRSKKGGTATLTPSVTAENVFLPQHCTVKFASTQAGLDAASAVSVKSIKLKIDQNLETDDVLGSLTPADFLNKQISIEGSVELLWNAETYKTLTVGATPQAMRIDLIHTTGIGTSSYPELKIDLYKVILKELTRAIALNDFVSQTFTFKAHYSASDSKMIVATLTNLLATVY